MVVNYQDREWSRAPSVGKEEGIYENGVENDDFEEPSGPEIGVFVKHQEIESNRNCGCK